MSTEHFRLDSERRVFFRMFAIRNCNIKIGNTTPFTKNIPVYQKSFLMREASSRWVCVCICVSVTLPLQICKMQKNTRDNVHIVSAREISTFLCVEMAMCLKILNIDSEREIFTFLDIDSARSTTLIYRNV